MVGRVIKSARGLALVGALALLALTPGSLGPGLAQETPPSDAPAQVEVAIDAAVLQGLDKITARISTFDAPIDQPVRFGSLEIVARTCHKTPPEEPPERAAFLEVTDVRPDSPAQRIFTGWMFASSPALSAMEHAVYDVWVIDCKKASNSAAETSDGN